MPTIQQIMSATGGVKSEKLKPKDYNIKKKKRRQMKKESRRINRG